MTREITDISEMTAYDWGFIAAGLMLLLATSSYLYCAFRLMGYLKVSRRRLWEELGCPQPGQIQVAATVRFIGWLIRGHYVQSGDPHLIRLARIARYSFFAVFGIYVIALIGGRLLLTTG